MTLRQLVNANKRRSLFLVLAYIVASAFVVSLVATTPNKWLMLTTYVGLMSGLAGVMRAVPIRCPVCSANIWSVAGRGPLFTISSHVKHCPCCGVSFDASASSGA